MIYKWLKNFGLVYIFNNMKKNRKENLFFSRSLLNFDISTMRKLLIL